MSSYNEEQEKVILELDAAMKNLFVVFVRVDEANLSMTDAMAAIGMEVPLFARPALNQLSGRIKEMRKEVSSSSSET